jgi:hypothetical protein
MTEGVQIPGRGVILRFHARYLASNRCSPWRDIVQAGRDRDAMARYPLWRWSHHDCGPADGGVMRYKTWRSRNTHLHILCVEGARGLRIPIYRDPPSRSLDGRAGGRRRPAAPTIPHNTQRSKIRGDPRPLVRAAVGGSPQQTPTARSAMARVRCCSTAACTRIRAHGATGPRLGEGTEPLAARRR